MKERTLYNFSFNLLHSKLVVCIARWASPFFFSFVVCGQRLSLASGLSIALGGLFLFTLA
jgi:hypothetical protein